MSRDMPQEAGSLLTRLASEFSFLRGNFLILLISWVIMDFAREIPGTYYPLYVRALGGTAATVGLIGSASMLSLALVQLPGGYLADKYGRRWLITTLTFGVALSYILPLLLLIHSDRPRRGGFRFRFVSRDALLRFSLLRSIIGFGAGLFINLIPYYLSVKFRVESDVIGVALSATFILSAITNLYAAKVSKALGIFRGALYTLTGVIPLYLGVVISPLYPLSAALYVARTGLMSVYTTLLISMMMMMRMVNEEERATVNSVVSLAESLSRGIGSAMGGVLMSRTLDLPGFLSVSVYASATIIFYLSFKERGEALGEA